EIVAPIYIVRVRPFARREGFDRASVADAPPRLLREIVHTQEALTAISPLVQIAPPAIVQEPTDLSRARTARVRMEELPRQPNYLCEIGDNLFRRRRRSEVDATMLPRSQPD